MPSTTLPRSRAARPVVAALVAAALAAASVLFFSPAAQAHDELVSSDPAADAALDAMPAELTLTFSGAISQEQGASEIQVTDAGGADVTAGDPEVTDNVLTQPLDPDANGDISVLWKVVSSDGHPISGEYAFTVTAAEPTESPSPTAEPTTTPTAEPTETAVESPTATPVPADADSDAGVWPWVVGGIIVAGLLGAVVYLLVSRARQKKALADSSASTQR